MSSSELTKWNLVDSVISLLLSPTFVPRTGISLSKQVGWKSSNRTLILAFLNVLSRKVKIFPNYENCHSLCFYFFFVKSIGQLFYTKIIIK